MGLSRSGADLATTLNDKLLHFTGYIIFIISAMIAFRIRHGYIFICLFAYSVMIEVIQYFLPYRTFSVMDILANLAGLFAGSVMWMTGKRIIAGFSGTPEGDFPDDEQR